MVRWLVGAIGLSVVTTQALAAGPVEIGIGYLGYAGVKSKLSLVEQPSENDGIAGARLAIEDNNTTGKFQLLDISPVKAAAEGSNLQACGGCDVQYAQRIGADLVITGVVRKISTLILNLTIFVRDVHTGQLITAMNADFRGNTDESWTRATSFLVRNRLLAPEYGRPQPQ